MRIAGQNKQSDVRSDLQTDGWALAQQREMRGEWALAQLRGMRCCNMDGGATARRSISIAWG